MPRMDHLAGAYCWSLKFTSTEASLLVPWTLAGVKYRVGLPELVHLEHGSLHVDGRVEHPFPAAEIFLSVSQMITARV